MMLCINLICNIFHTLDALDICTGCRVYRVAHGPRPTTSLDSFKEHPKLPKVDGGAAVSQAAARTNSICCNRMCICHLLRRTLRNVEFLRV